MSQFFFPYSGNKRKETNEIINCLQNDFDTVIEPFCGTAAISFELYKKNKNLKFVLSDNDQELINVYLLFKNEDQAHIIRKVQELSDAIKNKEDHRALVAEYKQNKSVYAFICLNKWAVLGRFEMFGSKKLGKIFKITKLQLEFIEFIKSPNVEILCSDWKEVYESNKNEEKTIFIMDPPYLSSCNGFYSSTQTNIYECFSYKEPQTGIYFVLEENWITKLLFKGYTCHTYSKKYSITKKKTTHAVYYLQKDEEGKQTTAAVL